MGISLSWQLVIVMALFLIGIASSELESPVPVTISISTSIDRLLRTVPTEKPVPIKISSVQHESFCINIYDSQTTKNNKKLFYYSPITAVLQHKNVALIHNKTVPQLYVNFLPSNQEVRNKVAKHLNQSLRQQIESSQVKVLPYDSVRLTSKIQSPDFSLTNDWIPHDKALRFTLSFSLYNDKHNM